MKGHLGTTSAMGATTSSTVDIMARQQSGKGGFMGAVAVLFLLFFYFSYMNYFILFKKLMCLFVMSDDT